MCIGTSTALPSTRSLDPLSVFLVSPPSEFDAKDKKKVFFVGVCSNFLGVSASLCTAAVAGACFWFCLPSSSAHQPFCTARLHARPSHPRWPSAPLSLARRCLCSPPRTFDHCSPAPRAALPAARHLPLSEHCAACRSLRTWYWPLGSASYHGVQALMAERVLVRLSLTEESPKFEREWTEKVKERTGG